jgi:PAS domain S-box-containing protein
MVVEESGKVVFKCHVENTVSHEFIDEVKKKTLQSYAAILNKEIKPGTIDESVTGNILDDNLTDTVSSFFNLPVVISGNLVGIINVASTEHGRYGESQASILYAIINQAATAVSKLQGVLESEKGKLSAIIYSLADGVFTLDLNHQLVVHNPAVTKILDIKNKESLTVFDIVDALAGKLDLRTKVDQAMAEDKTVLVEELFLKNKALEVTVNPVKNSSGEKIGVSVFLHDITTEKSLEKLRQEFTAMMVHELRAPLTAVRWSSESLIKNLSAAQGLPPEKIKETAVTIETASNNMLELVNDLLDVAKIEAGKFDLNTQEYDLVEVVKEQAKVFTPQAEVKHIGINVTCPEKLKVKLTELEFLRSWVI